MSDKLDSYLLSSANEEQRNQLQHKILKPKVTEVLNEILENYGLLQRLNHAKEVGSQVLFLDAGSGSGYFLQDLADLLKKNDLIQAANLNGLELKLDYVTMAEERTRQNPVWSKINYYQGDLTLPFEQNFSLNLEKKLQFDFISASVVMQYLPKAHEAILHLYHYLKPGGVLYLCDSYMVYSSDGSYGWQAPNKGIEELGYIATKMVRAITDGKAIAAESANWLREAGAEQVQEIRDLIEADATTELGLAALRYYISIFSTGLPVLLKMGLISEAQHEYYLKSIFEVNKNSTARLPFIHTIARKPE